MKLAHLADPHLGFRQFQRQTSNGINQREADVAAAFRDAIDGVVAAAPDAVVIAGDLFHGVRPTNAAIVFAFRQLQRLREALPGVPVVLIAGNHDTPRSSETGSILRLFEELGVDVATDEARRFTYPDRDLAILAVPHQALVGERPALDPSADARFNVLVLHGEAEGVMPADRGLVEYGGAVVGTREYDPARWSYVAWGHYHVQKQVAPRAWYAGALEYVSPDMWGERREEQRLGLAGKGWLLADLETGAVTPRPVRLARALVELEPLDAHELDAAQLTAAIAARVAAVPGGIADQVVRLVVRNVPRHVARDLDHAQVRAWKAAALQFQLDLRRPDPTRVVGVGAPGRRQTLPEIVRDFLAHRLLPGGVDRARFVTSGVELLEQLEREALEG